MNARNTLLVLPALAAYPAADGSFVLTRKFIEGASAYAERWPGQVIVAVERAPRRGDHLDSVAVQPEDVPFDLRWIDWETGADDVNALIGESRIVLASLVDKHTHLGAVCAERRVPLTYISEYSLNTRRQIIRAETANPVLRWRRERWTMQLEHRYRSALRMATGIQCNGTPTFEAYRAINLRPLLYFDTRVRESQLANCSIVSKRIREMQHGGPLRLAFSGRFIAMKGVDHLPLVAMELRRFGVPFFMDICGGGALKPLLRKLINRLNLSDRVKLTGVLEFHSQLLPMMARSIDLFVCCHRQGDPSCTYLETMSCGTPIAGYDNEALRGVVEQSGTGWAAPMDSPVELAACIAALHRNRELLAQGAVASLEFAAHHTFEKVMQSRVDHLLRCAAASSCHSTETVAS
jgi:colanic acid/amylovoran biosynthesis glycosyltransferase